MTARSCVVAAGGERPADPVHRGVPEQGTGHRLRAVSERRGRECRGGRAGAGSGSAVSGPGRAPQSREGLRFLTGAKCGSCSLELACRYEENAVVTREASQKIISQICNTKMPLYSVNLMPAAFCQGFSVLIRKPALLGGRFDPSLLRLCVKHRVVFAGERGAVQQLSASGPAGQAV